MPEAVSLNPPIVAAGGKRRILFVAEAVTLAHWARPLALARSLDPDRYEVFLAADSRYDALFPDVEIQRRAINTIPSEQFLEALASGRPAHDVTILRSYVEEDLRILREVAPHLVVGDFRLSLAVSAPLSHAPYMAITNAYWSPYANQRYPVPEFPPWTSFLPIRLFQGIFDVVRPLAFAHHARPLNQVRREYGLPGLGSDLRRTYTYGDYTLYSDIPRLVRLENTPPSHIHLGPILWSPAVPLPDWWDEVPGDRPIVYLTLGSSGESRQLPVLMEALGGLPVSVVVATAGLVDLERVPPNIFLADYLPGEVAAARADLVICNGGSPTCYQALAAGVPVIGIPANLDQYLNMHYLQSAGVGLLLRAGRLTTEGAKQAVETLLQHDSYRVRATSVRQEIAEYDFRHLFPALVDRVLTDT